VIVVGDESGRGGWERKEEVIRNKSGGGVMGELRNEGGLGG